MARDRLSIWVGKKEEIRKGEGAPSFKRCTHHFLSAPIGQSRVLWHNQLQGRLGVRVFILGDYLPNYNSIKKKGGAMDTKGPSALPVDMIPPFFILHAFFLTPKNQ